MDWESVECYWIEFYVVVVDIYSEGVLCGQGGWSWYIGFVVWIYCVVVEGLFGIECKDGDVVVMLVLFEVWNGFMVRIEFQGKIVEVKVMCSVVGQIEISVNGKKGCVFVKVK